MHVFGILHLFMVLLVPSWPLLGRSGSKMAPERTQDGKPRARSQAAGVILEALGLNMPLSCSKWPRVAQERPKLAQKDPKIAPRLGKLVKIGSRLGQDCVRIAPTKS